MRRLSKKSKKLKKSKLYPIPYKTTTNVQYVIHIVTYTPEESTLLVNAGGKLADKK